MASYNATMVGGTINMFFQPRGTTFTCSFIIYISFKKAENKINKHNL